jgi:hypothetical protein
MVGLDPTDQTFDKIKSSQPTAETDLIIAIANDEKGGTLKEEQSGRAIGTLT